MIWSYVRRGHAGSLREVILLLCVALVISTAEVLYPLLGSPVQERYGVSSVKGKYDDLGTGVRLMGKGRVSCDFSTEKAWEISPMCIQTPERKVSDKGDGARLKWPLVIKPEGMGTSWNMGAPSEQKFRLWTIIFNVRLSIGKGCPEKLWGVYPWRSCLDIVLGGPMWVELLDKMTFRGVFLPQGFCGSAPVTATGSSSLGCCCSLPVNKLDVLNIANIKVACNPGHTKQEQGRNILVPGLGVITPGMLVPLWLCPFYEVLKNLGKFRVNQMIRVWQIVLCSRNIKPLSLFVLQKEELTCNQLWKQWNLGVMLG